MKRFVALFIITIFATTFEVFAADDPRNPGITMADKAIIISDGSLMATEVQMTGDVTISNTGVTTIGALKVTNGMLAATAVTASKMVAGTVTSTEIADKVITQRDMLALPFAVRFCGQGANGATTTYISPDTDDGLGSLLASTHCDAEDSTTEATADDVLYETAFTVDAMVCQITDGGTDDTYTFQMRTAAGDVTGITCNVTLDGAGTETCSVHLATAPVSIAAGATVAVSMVATDDDCSACDALCTVFASF